MLPVENRGGSEHASPPGMPHRATGREDGCRGEMEGDVLSDLLDNGINPVMHQRASCARWCRKATPSCQEALLFSTPTTASPYRWLHAIRDGGNSRSESTLRMICRNS